MTETDIQAEIMLAVQARWPGALVLRQNTGVAYNPSGRPVRFGTPGQGDLRCVIGGRPVEIEVKTATGRQSKRQKQYQAAFERAGGIYVLARSPQEAVEAIDARLRG